MTAKFPLNISGVVKGTKISDLSCIQQGISISKGFVTQVLTHTIGIQARYEQIHRVGLALKPIL